MKPALLQHLIERAEQARDAAQRAVNQLSAQQTAASQTLHTLLQFRTEGLSKAPTRSAHSHGSALFAQVTEFDARMRHAIARQESDCQRLSAAVQSQRQTLIGLQQRAMALAALAQRQARAQQARAAKLDQKITDEFATLRAARASFRERP